MSNNLHRLALSYKISWLQTKDSAALHCWLAAAMRKQRPLVNTSVFNFSSAKIYHSRRDLHIPGLHLVWAVNQNTLSQFRQLPAWTCDQVSPVHQCALLLGMQVKCPPHTVSLWRWGLVHNKHVVTYVGVVTYVVTYHKVAFDAGPLLKYCGRSSLRFLGVASRTNWRFIESAMRGDWALASCYVIYVMSYMLCLATNRHSALINKSLSKEEAASVWIVFIARQVIIPPYFFTLSFQLLTSKRSKVSTLNLETGPWTGPYQWEDLPSGGTLEQLAA